MKDSDLKRANSIKQQQAYIKKLLEQLKGDHYSLYIEKWFLTEFMPHFNETLEDYNDDLEEEFKKL